MSFLSAYLGQETLDAHVRERLDYPAAVAPGTTMPDPGIYDPEDIKEVIDYLAAMESPLELTPENVTQ